MDELYNMGLHDTLQPAGECLLEIMRVPGGWLYRFACESGTGGHNEIMSFVPYHNEFMDSPLEQGDR